MISKKNINNGALTIDGTRISVWSLLQAISMGMTLREVASRINETNSANSKITVKGLGRIIKELSNQVV